MCVLFQFPCYIMLPSNINACEKSKQLQILKQISKIIVKKMQILVLIVKQILSN